MPDLTTLCRVKGVLEIPESDTTKDSLLRQLITEVSGLVEEVCGRKFGTATYTEFYSGDNSSMLVLAQRPVTAIVNLWEDEDGYWGAGSVDAFNADHLLVSGRDYALAKDQPDGSSRSGLVYRINGTWSRPYQTAAGNLSAAAPFGTGNIKVTYTAGFGAVPAAVELAVQTAVGRVMQSMRHGGLVSGESYSDYSYTLAVGQARQDGLLALPAEAVSMLGRYREPPIA
jgi:hypothetical protein